MQAGSRPGSNGSTIRTPTWWPSSSAAGRSPTGSSTVTGPASAQPAWDRVYAAELGDAIRILASKGAHVVVFTLPYVTQTTDAPDGTPWDINQPVRTNQYNALVRRTVARYPKVASVIDLNRLLDPGGVYRSTIDTVPVRDDDQEHISLYGGMFLRPQILPTLVKLGLPHEQLRNGPVTTTTTGR